MAVQQRVLQQGSGLETLKELLASVQNPKLITEAHETYRKEIALTEAEQARSDEARAFISKYDELSADIQKKSDAVSNEKAALQQETEKFTIWSESEKERLRSWKDALHATTVQQEVIATQQNSERLTLDKDRSNHETKAIQDGKKLENDRLAVDQKTQSNLEKEKDLGELNAKLKKLAESLRLREQAADLMG